MKPVLLLLLMGLCLSTSGFAQSRGKKHQDKFADDLWVGMHVGNLSFGTNYLGYGTFNVNLSPIVAYDLIADDEQGNFFSSLSAGVMLKFDYFYEKLNLTPQLRKYESVDLGPTILVRLLTFDKVFLQLEYEKGFFQRPVDNGTGQYVIENGKIKKETVEQDYVYLGLGYSNGDQWRYEISLYYNLLDEFDSVRIPFDYRLGIMYHF